MTFEEALAKLKEYNQEHLLKYYDDLKEEEKNILLGEIEKLDVKKIDGLYKDLVVNPKETLSSQLSSLKSVDIKSFSKEDRKRLISLGMEALRKGEVAILQVAGGQGSRLGYNGPKGTFSIGLPSNKELFKVQGERVKFLTQRCGHDIPWYIMTSPENNDATEEFFKNNNYMGLNKDSIKFYKQEVFPSVDKDGKIFLDSPFEISKNPNGSGGCFTSLKESGNLLDMKNKGIKYIFFCGVDNILVRMADPLFIGFAIENNKDITSKSVPKAYPEETVGVFTNKDGKPGITEYIELPPELAKLRDENGKLLYGSGNILNHVFKFDFLEKVLEKKTKYYAQHKKIKHFNGKEIEKPDSPNGYKFESLYFDTFSMGDGMAILDIIREEEFAPVKNKEGKDSKDSARELYLDLSTKWVNDLGIETKAKVEISPLLAYYGDELDKDYVEEKIKKGLTYID